MVSQVSIKLCEQCHWNDTVSKVTFTSCDYYTFCNLCGTYTETPFSRKVQITGEVFKEECNCEDRILHNNGGNYHYYCYHASDLMTDKGDNR